MSVTLHWYDAEETILIYNFDDNWTWDEFVKVDAPIWNMVNLADKRVDLILDMTPVEQFPIGLPPVMHRTGKRGESSKVGLVIIVDIPAIAQILYGVFRRIYPKSATHYRFTDTLSQALQQIEEDRDKSIYRS